MPPRKPVEPQRIAKLLARAGVASRREVERMIEEGRIAKDGVALETPATLLASLDGITVDGQPVAAPTEARLFLFHKPTGLLTTERDPRGRPTIYNRLPKDLPRLVPVGRLDLNTEGLLLLTTDGGLKRQLELPATGVERAYRARAYGQVSQPQLEALIEGIEIDGVRYGAIDANIERRTGANVWIELVLREGKNREVRRVLEHLGLQVSRLIRTRYGPFVLGDLPLGGIGEVRSHDVESFRANPTRLDLPQPARRRNAESGREGSVARSLPATGREAAGAAGEGWGSAPYKPSAPRPLRQPASRRAAPPRFEDEREPSSSRATSRPAKGPSLGRGSAKPRSISPAPTGEIANPNRAKRAVEHRQTTGRPDPEQAPATPRPAKLVRGKGWAKPKPKPGPRKPRRK